MKTKTFEKKLKHRNHREKERKASGHHTGQEAAKRQDVDRCLEQLKAPNGMKDAAKAVSDQRFKLCRERNSAGQRAWIDTSILPLQTPCGKMRFRGG